MEVIPKRHLLMFALQPKPAVLKIQMPEIMGFEKIMNAFYHQRPRPNSSKKNIGCIQGLNTTLKRKYFDIAFLCQLRETAKFESTPKKTFCGKLKIYRLLAKLR
jgi:hypothetical protein